MEKKKAAANHSGWLHRRVPGSAAREWKPFWCVLRPASICYYDDEACERPVDRLKLRSDTDLILVSEAEGYDGPSRRAIERLREEHPCSFAVCYEVEGEGDEGESSKPRACATVFHDALTEEALASWQEEVQKTLQRLQSAQSAIDNQCFIDDFSDYEDETNAKRSSYDATMNMDWTQFPGRKDELVKSRRNTACSQYEIDDGSDYEDDEVARKSSLVASLGTDWVKLNLKRSESAALQPTEEAAEETEQPSDSAKETEQPVDSAKDSEADPASQPVDASKVEAEAPDCAQPVLNVEDTY